MHEGPGRESGPFRFAHCDRLRLGGSEAALVTGCRVRVNESLASGAVEEADSGELVRGGGARGLRLLERSPKRGTLRTIAHVCRAGLPHVLLTRRDIRHV